MLLVFIGKLLDASAELKQVPNGHTQRGVERPAVTDGDETQ